MWAPVRRFAHRADSQVGGSHKTKADDADRKGASGLVDSDGAVLALAAIGTNMLPVWAKDPPQAISIRA